MRNQLKDYKQHKLKFNPYLEKLYQSDKPIIIYKVKDGYNIYTDFSKKIILTKNNIKYFLKSIEKKKYLLKIFSNLLKKKSIQKNQIYLLVFLVTKFYVI